MTPTKEEVAEALIFVEATSFHQDNPAYAKLDHDARILAAALRASGARAELIERQYGDMANWVLGFPWRPSIMDINPMLARHELERKELQG